MLSFGAKIELNLQFPKTPKLLFSISACNEKISFTKSTVVPAAQGDVQIKKDPNNNYKIDISVSDLADPSRLTPPKITYVVWVMTSDETAKNAGQLHISDLRASLKTLSASQPTKVFITAEDDPTVQSPSGVTVLTTEKF